MLVQAMWVVGYDDGRGKRVYQPGEQFECAVEWGKRKVEQGRVAILQEEQVRSISDYTTRDDWGFVDECEDPEMLANWIVEEENNKNRKTVLELLNNRLVELGGAG